ncbi:MAG: hypothetical protein MUF18_21895 [Fimbriiglobus sp.]|nr:hypothetical protein [Fimbriiglobus sp.]
MPRMLSLIAAVLATVPLFAADHPTHVIQSDQLAVTVYLPDAEKGYHRGTRFDWSGVFSVEYGKHKLFGPWKDNHTPTNHDDIVGPCEEFGTADALGYSDAKVGEGFLKVGVGELVKPKEEKYNRFQTYKFAKTPEWKTTTTPAKVAFEHAAGITTGYAYKYTKIVAVQGEEVRVQHILENTGTKAIKNDHYTHNFFNCDGAAVGEKYEVVFGFKPTVQAGRERWKELVTIDDRTLRLTGPLDKGSVFAELGGFGKDASQNRVDIRYKGGASVRVTGDKPLSAFNVWGVGTTICPEPFIQLDLEPGKKAVWSWTYTFSK